MIYAFHTLNFTLELFSTAYILLFNFEIGAVV